MSFVPEFVLTDECSVVLLKFNSTKTLCQSFFKFLLLAEIEFEQFCNTINFLETELSFLIWTSRCIKYQKLQQLLIQVLKFSSQKTFINKVFLFMFKAPPTIFDRMVAWAFYFII